MTKEEKAVQFVEDFIKYGFRIDIMPTRIFHGNVHDMGVQHDEYAWWSDYVSGAEKRLREAAKAVLECDE